MERSGLGVAVATNTDGTRAWIVSSVELSALQQHLKAIPDAKVIAEPRLMTVSSTAGGFSVGGVISAAADPASVRVTMDLIPEVISDSVRLTIAVTSTEAMASPANSVQILKTNLSAALRVLLPDPAGLVLAGDYAQDGGRTNWVLLLSPTVWRVRSGSIKSR